MFQLDSHKLSVQQRSQKDRSCPEIEDLAVDIKVYLRRALGVKEDYLGAKAERQRYPDVSDFVYDFPAGVGLLCSPSQDRSSGARTIRPTTASPADCII